ncbi:MAG: hypothetical protein INQ03_21520 [Candidatus Heimdallarchaeota archaeon]|nr:hypothetical protein [Candidatus Heimdallarchaeota archaeon]
MPDLTDEDQFIERAGIFFESMGLPQMSGRILGFLMIAEESQQSLTQITARLSVAKSTISTSMKNLITMAMVIKKGKPGSREDFYEINANMFNSAITNKVDAVNKFKELMRDALQYTTLFDDDRTRAMGEMVYFYEFFIDEYRKIFDKWEIHKLKLIAEGRIEISSTEQQLQQKYAVTE